MKEPARPSLTRREMLAASAATLMTTTATARAPSHRGRKVVRLGLIGCGGRGVGAVHNALDADEATVLTAVADVFAPPAEAVAGKCKKYGDRVRVVSVLSRELLLGQPPAERDLLLPPGAAVYAVEAGVGTGWEAITGGRRDRLFTVDGFGASGRPQEVADSLGFTAAELAARVRDTL